MRTPTLTSFIRLSRASPYISARISPLIQSRPRPFTAMASQAPEANAQGQAQQQPHSHDGDSNKRLNLGGNSGPGSRPQSKWKPKKTKREKNITEGSSEDILRNDIQDLLASRQSLSSPSEGAVPSGALNGQAEIEAAANANGDVDANGNATGTETLPEEGTEIDVQVLELSSTGDGLAMRPGSDQVYVVPFTIPGDTARVKVFRHVLRDRQPHTVADFVSIVSPSALRDDSRIRCKYFTSCGGCQFQMLDYSEQLKLKKRILEKAFKNFSNLPAEAVPAVQDTIGSPLQFGYRTKLTPHFDGPPGFRPSKRGKNPDARFGSCPDIGFMQKGKRRVLDIEDCPIGTEAVRLGNTRERERMKVEFGNYKRGATLLLRENTTRHTKESGEAPPDPLPPYTTKTEADGIIDVKSCETNSRATTTEYIDSYIFTNPAGSFFQNNNSILSPFTAYIREHVLPPSGGIKYLIDAYSGSGLFTITLSSMFQHSIGIDIAADSITSARKNATLNGLGEDRCQFIAADAGELFKSVNYAPDETAVILDPPRKGCDGDFLAQLRKFGPKRIVYVSCNVHTQARDVGVLVRGEGEGSRYDLEILRGFDFFPQTGHVEGVAILNRNDDASQGTSNGV